MSVKTRILIVEDNADMRNGLEVALRSEGYSTDSSENGTEALKMINDKAFDMVITDLVMPDVDGMDVLREIKKLKLKCPVIMITAFATIDNVVEVMKQGASDYIDKPFDLGVFVIRVKKVLEKARFNEGLLNASNTLSRTAVLKSLSNPIRLKIVFLLDTGKKMRLIQIQEKLGIEDPPRLSFHLRELKSAGILEQDTSKIYSLSDEGKRVADYIRNLK